MTPLRLTIQEQASEIVDHLISRHGQPDATGQKTLAGGNLAAMLQRRARIVGALEPMLAAELKRRAEEE